MSNRNRSSAFGRRDIITREVFDREVAARGDGTEAPAAPSVAQKRKSTFCASPIRALRILQGSMRHLLLQLWRNLSVNWLRNAGLSKVRVSFYVSIIVSLRLMGCITGDGVRLEALAVTYIFSRSNSCPRASVTTKKEYEVTAPTDKQVHSPYVTTSEQYFRSDSRSRKPVAVKKEYTDNVMPGATK